MEILDPESLRFRRPDTVIVMNPIYREEISSQLAGMGVGAEVLVV
jgi:hypothetical protein